MEQTLIALSTRKYRRSLEPVIRDLAEFSVSKSAVSPRFAAITSARLEAAISRPLGEEEWAALSTRAARSM